MVAEAGKGCQTVVVGYAIMKISGWNNSGFLIELAVRPDWKRNGTGKALIGRIRQICLEKGLRTVIVETQPDNTGAAGFYESMGMRICGYNDRLYTNTPSTARDIAIFYSMDIS